MQVVLTALRVLETVAEHQPVGVSEVARLLELPKTTVQRSLKALSEAGWIYSSQREPTRWLLTTRPLAVARHTSERGGLRDAVIGAMEQLRQETQETIHLAVLEGVRMVVVERLDSPMVVRSSYPLGFSAPVHASSTGKALLSCLPTTELEALLPASLTGYTQATITDRRTLLAEIERVRDLGYATNRGELRTDIGSVASPIRQADGRPEAAISISAPIHRMPDREMPRLGQLVAAAASTATLR